MTAHTETPFAVADYGDQIEIVNQETEFTVARLQSFGLTELAKVNAEFIARACNSHDALVNARKAFRDLYELCAAGVPLTPADLDKALAALSAAA